MEKSKKEDKKNRKRLSQFTYFFAFINLLVILLSLAKPTILFFGNESVVSGLILAIGIWGLLIWNSKRTLVVFILGIFFGFLAKFVLSPPLWICFLLGNISSLIYQMTREFKEEKIY